MPEIPREYRGWWRIVETSQWVNDDLDTCGTALLSLTGHADRLRMFVLLAYVHCKPTKAGVSFTWEGAWEFDQVSGSGSVKLDADGRLKGEFKIKNGDDSAFIAERTAEPEEPIPIPAELPGQVEAPEVTDNNGETDLGAEWQRAGGTLSDKTVRKGFGLTQAEIVHAIRAGKLQCRRTAIYGNPCLRLLRREVEALVRTERGAAYLAKQTGQDRACPHRLGDQAAADQACGTGDAQGQTPPPQRLTHAPPSGFVFSAQGSRCATPPSSPAPAPRPRRRPSRACWNG